MECIYPLHAWRATRRDATELNSTVFMDSGNASRSLYTYSPNYPVIVTYKPLLIFIRNLFSKWSLHQLLSKRGTSKTALVRWW